MISKVFEGHSFYHACRYMCNKPGAVVLATEGVRDYDHKAMSEDFILQNELRPEKTKACFHAVLSFYPGEDPGDEQMEEIAKEYLNRIGIVNTQYAITKHTDTDHLHLHIMANLVNYDGKTISDSWIGQRGKKTAQQLTVEYNLIPALKKDLSLTHLESLRPSDANRYKVYQAIKEALPRCCQLNDLEKQLALRGIEVQYKYKGQTGEKQGISFKIGDDCFKGSKVDRRYSLSGLCKIIELQSLRYTRKWTLKVRDQPTARPVRLAPYRKEKSLIDEIVRAIAKGMVEILASAMQSVESHETGLAYEFRRIKKKKRKKL